MTNGTGEEEPAKALTAMIDTAQIAQLEAQAADMEAALDAQAAADGLVCPPA